MTETVKFDWEKKIAELEKQGELQRREIEYQHRVMEVLIAVGHVSREKVEQAREIVSGFSSS